MSIPERPGKQAGDRLLQTSSLTLHSTRLKLLLILTATSALTSILPTHRFAGQRDGSLRGWPCSAWHRLGPMCAACCPKVLHPGAKMTVLKPKSQSCQLPASTSLSSHGQDGERTQGPSPGAFTPSPRGSQHSHPPHPYFSSPVGTPSASLQCHRHGRLWTTPPSWTSPPDRALLETTTGGVPTHGLRSALTGSQKAHASATRLGSPAHGQGQGSAFQQGHGTDTPVHPEGTHTQTALTLSYLQAGPSYCSVHFLLACLSEGKKKQDVSRP